MEEKTTDMNIKKNYELLKATELYTIGILLIYTVLAVFFFHQIDNSVFIVIQNILIITLALTFGTIASKYEKLKPYRKYYLVPFIYLIYSQVHSYIPLVNPKDFDDLLIKWDFALFGVHPTEWIQQFSHPILTEYLQFCYMTFFFMPIAHGIELHYRKKEPEFDFFTRQIFLGFYVSYLLYFIFPAIGPRFCVHDFALLSTDLPGLWLTEPFRNFINAGGGAPAGISNPAQFVNRDCMPSGHTMLTLMNIMLAFRFKSKLRYVFLIIGTSLIISTIYLRYHYVVDVIAGVVCALLVYAAEPVIRNLLVKIGFKNA